MEEVWGVIEAAGTLEVRIDRVRVVIKGEGELGATMDRGTHRVKMMEEWKRRRRKRRRLGDEEGVDL